MNKFLFTYAILLGLFLSSCNEDVFIEPFDITPEYSELGPGKMSRLIDVGGDDWKISQISYNDGDVVFYGDTSTPPWQDNVLHILTNFSSLSVRVVKNGIEVSLENYVANEQGVLRIFIENEFQTRTAEIKINPTGKYTIEIKNISYNLNTWTGYPDKDYIYNVYGVEFPDGLPEPAPYSFPQIKQLPIVYKFRLRGNDTEFTRRLLDSHINVPVPEYTWYDVALTPQPWAMCGKEAPLTTRQSGFESTVMVPGMPDPVCLPAGIPLGVSLRCHQECVGLQATINAVNPTTGLTEEVPVELIMYRPDKFTTELIMK